MLGLAKMAPDSWRYYAAEIASGREDYWAGHGEEAGLWLGRGAEHEGLSGEVEVDALVRVSGSAHCRSSMATATGPVGEPFEDIEDGFGD